MSDPKNESTRRDFLKKTGQIAAASTVLASAAPRMYAAEDNTIQVALIGCGGRGTGAASNALSVQNGPIKLVAMADVFDKRLSNSFQALDQNFHDQVDVTEDRKFIGFDAYKQAMDALNPGDVVILTTPPAFRWVHFTYAIEKGLNVFMEKPVTVDGPSTRRMLALGEESVRRNLKVGVGLMCRHCDVRRELFDRIQRKEIGDLLELRAYRMAGPTASEASPRNPGNFTDLQYQIRRFHSFLWLSGGCYSDFLIHNIDECCWMKDAWPVKADGSGGRHYRLDNIDQNFDHYSVEYTFADGSKLWLRGRTMAGCAQRFASYAYGTTGSAIISNASHTPAKSKIFKGHDFDNKDNITWDYPKPERNPYQIEWDDLIDAIRSDTPYNEVQRGAEASLVTAMGRMSAHTGQIITYDEMLNCEHELGGPALDQLTLESDSPLMPNEDGKYPVPMPGIVRDREYDPELILG